MLYFVDVDVGVFEKYCMTEDEIEAHRLTFLQKSFKSCCIIKNTFVLDKIMDARLKVHKNMYIGETGLLLCTYSCCDIESVEILGGKILSKCS